MVREQTKARWLFVAAALITLALVAAGAASALAAEDTQPPTVPSLS